MIFFTIKTQEDNLVLLASGSPINTPVANVDFLVNDHYDAIMLAPHHTLMHDASSSSKHKMLTMTNQFH